MRHLEVRTEWHLLSAFSFRISSDSTSFSSCSPENSIFFNNWVKADNKEIKEFPICIRQKN